jgi:hypothetical protein
LSFVALHNVAMLVKIAATPSKNEPSIITIADSFHVGHVLLLFLCRKGDSVVSVIIKPIPDSVALRVTGDITTTLAVPYDDDDRFLVGFSDGTLLIGTYNEELECGWTVAREGAGLVRVVAVSHRLNGAPSGSQCRSTMPTSFKLSCQTCCLYSLTWIVGPPNLLD